MARGVRTKSGRGAVATGAAATGAASLGAMAVGAVALGALAVGALAVGRLSVGRARLRRVEIGELTVGRLEIGSQGTAGTLTAVARIQTAPGQGDAFQRLLLEQAAASEPGALTHRVHRSLSDPDRFLIHETDVDEAAFEQHKLAPHLDALFRQASALGLVTASPEDLAEELYRSI